MNSPCLGLELPPPEELLRLPEEIAASRAKGRQMFAEPRKLLK